MLDLWPEEIKAVTLPRPPVIILKEQAALLGERTKNLIEGKVLPISELWRTGTRQDFGFEFVIAARSLRYTYRLFSIFYSIEFYPVSFQMDEDIVEEMHLDKGAPIDATNEDEFLEILKTIFGAKKTKQVIGALLSQIEAGTVL